MSLDCFLWGCEAWANHPAAPMPGINLLLSAVIILGIFLVLNRLNNKGVDLDDRKKGK